MQVASNAHTISRQANEVQGTRLRSILPGCHSTSLIDEPTRWGILDEVDHASALGILVGPRLRSPLPGCHSTSLIDEPTRWGMPEEVTRQANSLGQPRRSRSRMGNYILSYPFGKAHSFEMGKKWPSDGKMSYTPLVQCAQTGKQYGKCRYLDRCCPSYHLLSSYHLRKSCQFRAKEKFAKKSTRFVKIPLALQARWGEKWYCVTPARNLGR